MILLKTIYFSIFILFLSCHEISSGSRIIENGIEERTDESFENLSSDTVISGDRVLIMDRFRTNTDTILFKSEYVNTGYTGWSNFTRDNFKRIYFSINNSSYFEIKKASFLFCNDTYTVDLPISFIYNDIDNPYGKFCKSVTVNKTKYFVFNAGPASCVGSWCKYNYFVILEYINNNKCNSVVLPYQYASLPIHFDSIKFGDYDSNNVFDGSIYYSSKFSEVSDSLSPLGFLVPFNFKDNNLEVNIKGNFYKFQRDSLLKSNLEFCKKNIFDFCE